MTEAGLLCVFLGVFGLLLGSFLNVVVYRLPHMLKASWRHECEMLLNMKQTPQSEASDFNLFLPRSFCVHCKKTIPFWHNIPLVSFIILRGKCAFCRSSISLQYPLIEATCSFLFLLAGFYFNLQLNLFFALVFIGLIICLTTIDLQHQLLPDSLTQSLLWLGLLANINQLFVPLSDAVIGAIAGYMTLWLVTKLFYLVTGRVGMGHGDFKLLAALGAWFGWTALPFILLFSSLTGAIIGLIYLKITKQSKTTPIPFGPFLCFSGLITLFMPHFG